MYKHIYHELQPYINKDSKILILGSLPSIKSRESAFYYMHPQNRFWKVLKEIFEDDFDNSDISIKTALLKKHKIALYDVIESCYIINSDDASIKDVEPADIKSLIKISNINRIYINGKKAFNIFKKYNPDLLNITEVLPSTSPANARYSLDKLVISWKSVIKNPNIL